MFEKQSLFILGAIRNLQNAELLAVKDGGTYSCHSALKGLSFKIIRIVSEHLFTYDGC
jgi:hypothetical protein